MRLFLDANVMFSAARNREAVAMELWNHATAGRVKLITSTLAITECVRNLADKHPEALDDLSRLLADVAVTNLEAQPDPRWSLRPADAELLAIAIRSGATHFVTGDKHFMAVKGGDLPVSVVSTREVLTELQGEQQ